MTANESPEYLEGYDAGYNKGNANGYDEGYEAGKVGEYCEALDDVLSDVDDYLTQAERDDQPEVVRVLQSLKKDIEGLREVHES